MPITNTYLNAGDPIVEANGQYRGTVNFVFDDGRTVARNLRAPDEDAWSALLLNIDDEVEAKQQAQDAEEAAETDVEVLNPYKQSSVKQMALAYLRNAMSKQDPYVAFLKFSKFNDWRVREGYNLNQVQTALMAEGLTEEDWQDMRDRYSYLSNAGRVSAMQAYQAVVAGDVWAN